MKKSLSVLMAICMIVTIILSACSSPATPAPEEVTQAPAGTEVPQEATEASAATEAPAEDTTVSMVPAKSGSPFDIKGKKVCSIIPSLANPILNGVSASVKEKFMADGV